MKRYILYKPVPVVNYRIKEKNAMLFFLFFFMCCTFSVWGQNETSEYDIKAAFIYRFTNYIDWGPFMPGNEFIIGIVGSSPVKEGLIELARTKTINNRKIVIRQFRKADDITPCQILFIAQETPVVLAEILAKAGKGTLTVSEKEGYAKRGVDINFIEVDNKLKFEANPGGINAAGLKASSQLLKLAVIIE